MENIKQVSGLEEPQNDQKPCPESDTTKSKEKNFLLDCFQSIADLIEKQGLNDEFFNAAQQQLTEVSAILEITHLQAALFTLLLVHSGSDPLKFERIAKLLNCGNIQLMKYLCEFEILEQKKLIRAISWDNATFPPVNKFKAAMPSYIIPFDVIQAVRNGKAYQCTDYNNLTPENFLITAGEIMTAVRNDEICLSTACVEIKYMISANSEICFAKDILSKNLNDLELFVLTFFCIALFRKGFEKVPLSALNRYIGFQNTRYLRQKMASGEHQLIKSGFLENVNNDGMANTEMYKLTEQAKKSLLADVSHKKNKNKHSDSKDFIRAKEIQRKELFYSDKLKKRIEELTDLLRHKNFIKIINRLSGRNMKTAFTCLFSGPPGTGKTETAYQIAKSTGRNIFLVDISETKSMWFGESEKKIKALFDHYNRIVKNGGKTPILLFNEADAVLGKRQELGDFRHGPAQTENAIQNIILSEMENLSGGILIATTNMTCNLDKAFERRFLYKLEFENPDEQVKAAIWKNIMPSLTLDDTLTLSRRYNFSGGQIDNIARKEAVSSIMHGKQLSLEEISALCDEELIDKKIPKIGFIV